MKFPTIKFKFDVNHLFCLPNNVIKYCVHVIDMQPAAAAAGG